MGIRADTIGPGEAIKTAATSLRTGPWSPLASKHMHGCCYAPSTSSIAAISPSTARFPWSDRHGYLRPPPMGRRATLPSRTAGAITASHTTPMAIFARSVSQRHFHHQQRSRSRLRRRHLCHFGLRRYHIVNDGPIEAGVHGIHAGGCEQLTSFSIGGSCTYGDVSVTNSGAITAGRSASSLPLSLTRRVGAGLITATAATSPSSIAGR